MLNDAQRQLLTLFVDGEADAAQRRAVAELVRDVPEARQLLHALQQDSQRLQALPRASLSDDFALSVQKAIADRGMQRTVPVLLVTPRQQLRRWGRLAAAAVLLAAGTFGFMMLRHMAGKSQPSMIASAPARVPALPKTEHGSDPAVAAVLPKKEISGFGSAESESGVTFTADDAKRYEQLLVQIVNPVQQAFAGLAEAGSGLGAWKLANDALVTPLRPSVAFKGFDVRLPPLEDLRSMDQQKFMQQLNERGFQQADISCQESWKALDRFEAACRAQGIKLLIDPDAAIRRSKKLPAMYVIYLENAAPDRVLKIFQALQAEDKKAEAKSKGDNQFNTVLLQPLDESLRKWLAEMLGVPASSLTPPKSSPKGPVAGLDPSKPLSQDTAKALEKIASGSQAAPKAKEPTALVLVNGPARVPGQLTKEAKQFVEGRSPLQMDAVHIVFVLRPTKG